jgi:oligosaccharyltransferase complex subunit alpha (ribophorin I)
MDLFSNRNTLVSDIEVFPPSRLSSSVHTMYLDTIGRPTVAFKYENLTSKHTGVICIVYMVSLSTYFKKPGAIGVALFNVFFVALWK